jgi:hypothetical protein
MQEIRHFKPPTVSQRFSVVAGFYRTCVIDGLLHHSPAEHVRRPAVPPESPTLGFTHLQFEALLTAARQSPDPCRAHMGSQAPSPRLVLPEGSRPHSHAADAAWVGQYKAGQPQWACRCGSGLPSAASMGVPTPILELRP